MSGGASARISINDPNAVHVPDRPGRCRRSRGAPLPFMTWNKPALATSGNWLELGGSPGFRVTVITFPSLCPKLAI